VNRERKGLLTLLFLSPLLAELVSGSSPPLEFFNPVLLPAQLALYGCGALLIRDAVIRWDKGWATLLLLGAAYGVYEEGLALKSWFDPNWNDLGTMAAYGRVAGMNWIWAETLTIFHAVVSIAIPIFLLGVLYPDLKGKRLLTPRGTKWALVAFAAVGLIFVLGLPYWGGPEHLIAVFCAGFFVYVARIAPKDFLSARAVVRPRRVWPFALFGFLWMLGNFLVPGMASSEGVYFGFTIFIVGAVAAACLFILSGALHPASAERCLFAFFGGVIGMVILLGFFYGSANPGVAFGEPVASVAAAVWFIWLYRRNLTRWKDPGSPPGVKVAALA
jgi:hypothetical protein